MILRKKVIDISNRDASLYANAINTKKEIKLPCGDYIAVQMVQNASGDGLEVELQQLSQRIGLNFSVEADANVEAVAAVLDAHNKKPRTRTEYVEASIDDLIADEPIFYKQNNGEYHSASMMRLTDYVCNRPVLYKAFEREVTWQEEIEEFIDGMEFNNKGTPIECIAFAGNEDKRNELVRLCHLVASLTDKPE